MSNISSIRKTAEAEAEAILAERRRKQKRGQKVSNANCEKAEAEAQRIEAARAEARMAEEAKRKANEEERIRKAKEAEEARRKAEEEEYRKRALEAARRQTNEADEAKLRAKEREERMQREEERKEKREDFFMVLGIATGVLALIWFCVETWQMLNGWLSILLGVLFGLGVFTGASGLLIGNRDAKRWFICLRIFIFFAVILFATSFSFFLSLFAGLFCSGLFALVCSMFSLFED